MLNLVHLRSFVALVEAGSFHGAAQALGVAQPTVTQHIQKLESEMGQALVRRGHGGCTATAAGEALLPLARSLLRLEARARTVLAERPLAVGASGNLGTYLLPPYIHAFGGTSVDLSIGTNTEVAARLADGEIDLAVMEWWDGRPGFAASVWRREKMVVIVPPDHPWAENDTIAKDRLLDAPLIGGEPGTGTGRLLAALFGADADRLRVMRQLGSTEAVKQAVRAGLGVSIVLEGSVEEEVRAGSLRALPLANADLVKDLYVALPDGQPPTAPGPRFAALLSGTAE